MLRALFSFFGGIFTLVVTGLLFAALMVGGVIWMYGSDLPDHEELARYTPKTISRVYSGEGQIIDEFAVERRLFVPASDIPKLVKEAFISAEDKNFYIHKGFDPISMVKAALDEEARRRAAGRADASIPFRPDHGQDILDDLGRQAQPGYPSIGRLKGLAELRGVIAALSHGQAAA